MPEWLTHIGILAFGVAILAVGGECLVHGAARLARILGISTLVVGLTVVAFGTSAPEAAVTVYAGLRDSPDLAVGNVVGSNIANILLILGLAAVMWPLDVSRRILHFDAPIMIAAAILLYVLAAVNGQVDRWNGGIFVAGLVAYTAITYAQARRHPEIIHPDAEPLVGWGRLWWYNAVLVGGGIGGLVLGARFIVSGASGIALIFGVSEHVIGLTIVAIGTSLPELATTVAAARQKHHDIAIGNVVGSNIFNVLFVMGLAGLTRPLSVPAEIIRIDGPLMIAACVLSYPLLATRRHVTRLEGGVLLSAYVGYLGWNVYRATA